MDVLRKSWGRPESASQGRLLNVRLALSLDVISGCPQSVRLRNPQDRQIGSLGDVLESLEEDVLETTWGPIFEGWVFSALMHKRNTNCHFLS